MKSYLEKSIAAYVRGIERAIREGRAHDAKHYTINLVRAVGQRDGRRDIDDAELQTELTA